MATSTEAPRQFKQPSRKGKKAWRKNVDLTEIQEGLETVRDEIISGGVITEKDSSELFAVDTIGDKTIAKSVRKGAKTLKADEILAARSSVPSVDSRKRSSRVTDGVLEPSNKKRRGGTVPFRELQRLREIAYGGESVRKDIVEIPERKTFDPWSENSEENKLVATEKDPRFSFLEPSRPVKEPKTLKQAPISLAANGKEIPAVKKPETGISYNPMLGDYMERLDRKGQKEVEAEKKRLQEAETERQMLERAAAAELEKESASSSDEEPILPTGEEVPTAAYLARKRPERKTQAQKNKIKRRKEAEREAAIEAQMKRKALQAAEISKIKRAIEAKERQRLELVARKGEADVEEGDDRVLRRRKFGKIPVAEPPLEIVLPEELQESLRLLKPEGNLVKERFRTMLVRGRIETRRPIAQWKKKRRDITEKWTYKDFKI